MSNTKHTPGPWTVYAQPQEWPGIDSDTMSIIIFGEEGDLERGIKGESFTEAMANARLIAAAPDLLAALEHILADPFTLISKRSTELARAAIAAARGEK